ncbi:MAG TPA: universal stress protein [Albitalea sp.]
MYDKILVPIDGSPTSMRGLDEAIKLGKLTGAQLRLLHVVDMLSVSLTPDASMMASPTLFELLREGGQTILAKAMARCGEADVAADTMLVDTLSGRVSEIVVEEARRWGAELIVIGTHGRRGVSRLVMGSDAEQVLRLASVPVLLVRAPQPGEEAR